MNSTDLPNDVEALKAELLEQLAQIQSQQSDLENQQGLIQRQRGRLSSLEKELEDREVRLERMKAQLERLRRIQFGRSSEKIDAHIAQLELAIGSLEAEDAWAVGTAQKKSSAKRRQPLSDPIPDHLPRDVITHDNECACPDCGGTLDFFGEDVTEILDYVPASFTVKRHVRPKHRCRRCQSIVQAPAVSRIFPRSRAGAGLLAQVLTAKYADHLPLYRQTEIYAREGVPLSRSTLADWVGASTKLLRPLGDALFRYVMAGTTVHGDDTTVPVLAPGRGKTKTGRLWAYARDERPAGGTTPPAVAFRFSRIARASTPTSTWPRLPAPCTPTALPGSTPSTGPAGSTRPPAGPTSGASSTTSGRRTTARRRKRHSTVSGRSTPSRPRFGASRPRCAAGNARPRAIARRTEKVA